MRLSPSRRPLCVIAGVGGGGLGIIAGASVEERVTTCPCFASVISGVFFGPQMAIASFRLGFVSQSTVGSVSFRFGSFRSGFVLQSTVSREMGNFSAINGSLCERFVNRILN